MPGLFYIVTFALSSFSSAQPFFFSSSSSLRVLSILAMSERVTVEVVATGAASLLDPLGRPPVLSGCDGIGHRYFVQELHPFAGRKGTSTNSIEHVAEGTEE